MDSLSSIGFARVYRLQCCISSSSSSTADVDMTASRCICFFELLFSSFAYPNASSAVHPSLGPFSPTAGAGLVFEPGTIFKARSLRRVQLPERRRSTFRSRLLLYAKVWRWQLRRSEEEIVLLKWYTAQFAIHMDSLDVLPHQLS